jgi:hypothetical protein
LFIQATCTLYGDALVTTRTGLTSLYLALPISDAAITHELGQPPFGLAHITKILG